MILILWILGQYDISCWHQQSFSIIPNTLYIYIYLMGYLPRCALYLIESNLFLFRCHNDSTQWPNDNYFELMSNPIWNEHQEVATEHPWTSPQLIINMLYNR